LLTQVTSGKYQPLAEMNFDGKGNVEYPVIEPKHCKAIVELAHTAVGQQIHKRDVLLLHGDDFWYQRADINFFNLDVVLDHCNKMQK
jgi:hypothetical protein